MKLRIAPPGGGRSEARPFAPLVLTEEPQEGCPRAGSLPWGSRRFAAGSQPKVWQLRNPREA